MGRRFKSGEHNIAAILTPELVVKMRKLQKRLELQPALE